MKTLAVSGKGGVGKTTLASLLVKLLSKRKVSLAVDADPNTNLNLMLGVDVDKTIGQLREDITEDPEGIPNGMSKQEYIKYQLQMAIVEGSKFDLIAMGRQDGPGCYCYINNLLRVFMDSLAEKYPYVVIDNEAGMEHLSRRTTKNTDFLFIVSDATQTGVLTAERIKGMTEELKLNTGTTCLVLNKTPEVPENLQESISKGGFDYVVTIPEDKTIAEFVSEGKPLIDLPETSPSFIKLKQIAKEIGI
ncbi:MAG: AAA family ATPase [Methanobacteriota archaeon]|nr:MAG: AAA family ATPase [Euryarchaeota archaeon]